MDVPAESHSDFDFRDPPMSADEAEEEREGDREGGMSAEGGPTESSSADMMAEGSADSDPKSQGCDQSSSMARRPTPHFIGLILLGLMGVTRRERSAPS
jgi:hypothetical protein